MPGCAVSTCKNFSRKGGNIRYFRFPKNSELCQRWILACKRGNKFNVKNAYICSAHFEPDCFAEPSLQEKLMNYTSKTKRGLKPDAMPKLNLPDEENRVDINGSLCMTKQENCSEITTFPHTTVDINFAYPSRKGKILNYTLETSRRLKQEAMPNNLNESDGKNKVNSDGSLCMIKQENHSQTITFSNTTLDTDRTNDISDILDVQITEGHIELLDRSYNSLENYLSVSKEQKEILELKKKLKYFEQENIKLKKRVNYLEGKMKQMKDMTEQQ